MSIEMINSTSRDFVSTCPICNANPLDLHCPICDIELEGDSLNLRICKNCLLESFKSNDYVFQCPHCKKPLEMSRFISMFTLIEIEDIFKTIGKRLFDDVMFTNLQSVVNGATLYNVLSIDCNNIYSNIESLRRIFYMILIESPKIPHISRATRKFKPCNFESWWNAIKDRDETDACDYSTDKLEQEAIFDLAGSKRKSLLKVPLKKSIDEMKLNPYILYRFLDVFGFNNPHTDVHLEDLEKIKKTIISEFISSSPSNISEGKLLFKCSKECGGFVMNDYICNLCNAQYCRKCGLILDDTHTQDLCKNNSQTFKYILSTTQSCPKCAIRINKSEGCDVMFCTFCHICFSYKTGKELKGNLHNPHRLEWLKSLDKPATFSENENGVCIDVRNYDFHNLYSNPDIRGRLLELQDIINHTEHIIQNTSLHHKIRNYIYENMLPRVKPNNIDILRIASMTFDSIRYEDIYDRLHTLIDTITDYMQYYSQKNELEYEDILQMHKLDEFIDNFAIETIDTLVKLKMYLNEFKFLSRFSYKIERYINRMPQNDISILYTHKLIFKDNISYKNICGEDSPFNILLDFPDPLCEKCGLINKSLHNYKDSPYVDIKWYENIEHTYHKGPAYKASFISFCSTSTLKAKYIGLAPYGLELYNVFEQGFDDESFELYRKNELYVGSLLNYILMNIYVGKPNNLPRLNLAKDLNSYVRIQNNRAFRIYKCDPKDKKSAMSFISPFIFYLDKPVISNFNGLMKEIMNIICCKNVNVDDIKSIKYFTLGIFIYIFNNLNQD